MPTQPETARRTAGRPQLHAALLDYHRHPGSYSLPRREPAILFASIRAILQLAAGKADDDRSAALQPAAAFFVRTALTHPGADHYTLLGVERTSDAATIKEHYRLMMRLVHPDFASTVPGAAWPADAATRLNLAYGVLASPEKRARYNEETAVTPPKPMPRPLPAAGRAVVARPNRTEADPRLLVKRLAAGFGAAGALGVVALFAAGGSDRETLVQRDASFKTAFLAPLLEARTPEPASVLMDEHPVPAVHPPAPPAPPATPWPAQRALVATAAPAVLPAPPQAEAIPSPAVNAMPAPVALSAPAVPAPPMVVTAPAMPPPAAPAPAPKPNPGVTLAEVQPLLATLLQHIESGRGDRLLTLLERDARNTPAARALSKQLDALAEGGRPLRLAHVEFRAEPADGRLYVIGHIKLQPGDAAAGAARDLSMRVEFMSREGAAAMTGLSALRDN